MAYRDDTFQMNDDEVLSRGQKYISQRSLTNVFKRRVNRFNVTRLYDPLNSRFVSYRVFSFNTR